jgi:hypothetical protein
MASAMDTLELSPPLSLTDLSHHTAHAALPVHARKALALISSWAARAAGNRIATAELLTLRMDPETWGELWQIQQAAWQRQQQWQNDLWQGLLAWTRECAEIKGANTMSKLVEQEFNLAGQLGDLMRDQATGLVALMENVQVDYAYWVNQKLRS